MVHVFDSFCDGLYTDAQLVRLNRIARRLYGCLKQLIFPIVQMQLNNTCAGHALAIACELNCGVDPKDIPNIKFDRTRYATMVVCMQNSSGSFCKY